MGGGELIVQERSFLEALNTFFVIGIGSVIGLKEKPIAEFVFYLP